MVGFPIAGSSIMFGCAHCSFSLYRIRIYLASSVLKLPLCRVVPNLRSMTCFFECMKLCFDCLRSQQGSLRRFESLGGLGEGSGWDLRVRPAPAAAVWAHLRGPQPGRGAPRPSRGALRPKAQARPGRSRDQAWPWPDFWKFGNLEPENPEI